MPKRREESGETRQQRLQREQHRPEQNRGYDETVRGGPGVAGDRGAPDVAPPAGVEAETGSTIDECEAEGAREDVRRHERSASRPASREP